MSQPAEVALDTRSVVDHLRTRGLLGPTSTPVVSELAGGVSGVVLSVVDGERRLVVKQALAQLRTEQEWRCDPRRILVEAEGMRLCHDLTPAYVPEVLDLDEDRLVLVMTGAPSAWQDWRQQILSGAASRDAMLGTATQLGRVLGDWHARTRLGGGRERSERLAAFADRTVLAELRVDPFHSAVVRQHPDLMVAVGTCADELLAEPECLVHGDFSPKNVLVGGEHPWVLDYEVAHLGRAVFDLAFCSSHLALKALHLPDRAGDLHDAWAGFIASYANVAGPLPKRFGWHTACLMLARVDGVSPATYLTGPERDTVRRLSRATLLDQPAGVEALWDAVLAAADEETHR